MGIAVQPTTTSLILAWGTPISSAWFSILAPNATLTSHVGEYKGILRYHLAIEVPAIHVLGLAVVEPAACLPTPSAWSWSILSSRYRVSY